MIFDKCKNCKYAKLKLYYKRAIFSKKPKERYKEVFCNRRIWTFKKNHWCQYYERKINEKNNKHCVYNYTCPNCHTILSEVEDCNYCPNCGTKLDWSKNE